MKLEREELAFRVEELEQIINELGGSHRIPVALDFPQRVDLQEVAERRSSAEDENLLRAGVGSLTIDDQDGSVRFLGTSAASGYFATSVRRPLVRFDRPQLTVAFRRTGRRTPRTRNAAFDPTPRFLPFPTRQQTRFLLSTRSLPNSKRLNRFGRYFRDGKKATVSPTTTTRPAPFLSSPSR